MEVQFFKELFEKSPNAYSCLRTIMDEQGNPYDYEFLAVNKAYEKVMGVQAHNLINKRFYEVFPLGWDGEWQWKEKFNTAILSQSPTRFDMHHFSIDKWIRVKVFP